LSELDYNNRRQAEENRHDDSTHSTFVAHHLAAHTVIYNPVEYTCGKEFKEKKGWWSWLFGATVWGSTYGCNMVFCHEDGCNREAKGFSLSAFQFIWDLPQYAVVGVIFLALFALLGFLLFYLFASICNPVMEYLKNCGKPAEMYEPIA
jgi:hypothetical protein